MHLAAVRTAYANLLNDDASAREIEAKIRKLDPAWYPTRGMVFSAPIGTKGRLRVEVIPTSVFVGRDGIIHYRKVGFNEKSVDEIEAVLNKLL